MKVTILTLCLFFIFITFANAGEVYSCIDRDGNSIVTDNPQDGMNCKSQNENNIDSSAKNKKSNIHSWMPDSDCFNEYENTIDTECVNAVGNKLILKLSPYCSKLLKAAESEKFVKDCEHEMDVLDKELVSDMQKCHKNPVSSECKKQMVTAHVRMLEENNKCTAVMKRMYGICGSGQSTDYACYGKHRQEFKAACGGI